MTPCATVMGCATSSKMSAEGLRAVQSFTRACARVRCFAPTHTCGLRGGRMGRVGGRDAGSSRLHRLGGALTLLSSSGSSARRERALCVQLDVAHVPVAAWYRARRQSETERGEARLPPSAFVSSTTPAQICDQRAQASEMAHRAWKKCACQAAHRARSAPPFSLRMSSSFWGSTSSSSKRSHCPSFCFVQPM